MKHLLTLEVEAPEEFTVGRVAGLINKIIDVGLADARDSAEDPHMGELAETAAEALRLDIKSL